jgi:SAM-dependent methyltransferase
MTQNIYDDATFFEGYSQLPRSKSGLDGAPEWPRLRRLLPSLEDAHVIDLGCGFGWFSRYARETGAARVTGYDVSANMLARARSATQDEVISYVQADLETLTLAPGSADLVYSSLAFHYLEHLDRLIGQIARALKPGGAFVFSVEHPIFTAPETQDWIADGNGRKSWPLNSYQNEGPRVTHWLAEGVVKQHRTLATYLNMLIRHGLTFTHLEEWAPDKAMLATAPQFADERERPTFLIIAAQKNF